MNATETNNGILQMNIFYREEGGLEWIFLCCCKESQAAFWINHDKKTHSYLNREYTQTWARFPL